MNKPRRALISVYDKTGVTAFAHGLAEQGFEIVSSGGTSKVLREAKVNVQEVEQVTQFPEMLDGRVKTLHPRVHAGILARRERESHMAQLEKQHISPIEMVVVNLYPFRETLQRPNSSQEEIVENIDIGGPSLIRAAAKNYAHVGVIVNPTRYEMVLEELRSHTELSLETRAKLAHEAFSHTAFYDAVIAGYFSHREGVLFPHQLSVPLEKIQDTRYGENPHQRAAFYRHPLESVGGITDAIQLQGKALSFNNINDAHAALELSREWEEPTAVIVKHANPCGVAQSSTLEQAFRDARECDPASAFGGVIALNQPCTPDVAEQVISFFNEIILAPAFDTDAIEILAQKEKLRVLKTAAPVSRRESMDMKKVGGGMLVQEADDFALDETRLEMVSTRKPSSGELEGLLFGWKVAKHVKSNAIVLCTGTKTVGIGAGQMSRVDAARMAVEKAGPRAKESVMASDAFFPFRDSIDTAAAQGITAVMEPGGSIKDAEVIDAANEHGIALVFTGIRHFRH